MTESLFEADLQRLFRQAPMLDDAEAFAARVRRRLERGWALRRALIGVAGAAGGLVAAAQLVGSNLFGHLFGHVDAVSDTAALRMHQEVLRLAGRLSAPLAASGLSLGGGEAMWMVAGLAGVGVALIAARVLEAF